MKQSLASTLIALCILSLSACNYCEALEPDSSALSENTGDRALGLERGLAKGLNVVVIVADDLGWNDVGFTGASDPRTPNLDALASDSLVFENFYASAACTPMRTCGAKPCS